MKDESGFSLARARRVVGGSSPVQTTQNTASLSQRLARGRGETLVSRATPWIVAGAVVLLAIRLGRFIDRYAVNVVYWDQWDFLQGLFDGADAWTLFRWQHGPQRQGFGNLIIALLYPATGWNGKADAAMGAFVMLLAALAGLWLVRRLCGPLRPWDVVVPLLFLTTTNVETYVLAPNLAHGPLPALFLTTYALALTVRSHALKCAWLVAINFAAVNTGFTVLMGGITPAILLVFAGMPGLTRRERAIYLAGVAASLATVALFLKNFVPLSATACFQFPHGQPLDYIPYAGFVLARPLGFEAEATPRVFAMGTAVATAAVGLAGYATFRFLVVRGNSERWAVIGTLTGFAVVYAAATAVGRVCLGVPSANASRYIPYVIPGLLGLYLALRSWSAHPWIKTALLSLLLVGCVQKERSPITRFEATTYSNYKQDWVDCYLDYHDIAECDARVGHAVYPVPEATHLQQKLDWLEERGYSLFQGKGGTSKARLRTGEP